MSMTQAQSQPQAQPASASRRGDSGGAASAMLIKEFIQLQRDRVSFAMIVMIPLMQLMLFGYAINTTPRDLPTAVLLQESSDVGRSILRALQNTKYFKVTHSVRNEAEFDQLLASGTVLFAIEIPADFERALRRGDRPAMLVAADATDPVASGSALAALRQRRADRAAHDRAARSREPLFEFRTHARYNPAGRDRAQHRAGPGRHHPHHDHADLHRAVGDARDRARHHGKPAVDADHAGRDHARQDRALCAGRLHPGGADRRHRHSCCSTCRSLGSLSLLALLSTLFIAANLSIGYTFSTLAQNQLQAMQMSMMFFLPNILLSGFMFPFAGMPVWAQWIGEALPLTHYLRIVRAIMLKGATLRDLHYDALALVGLMLIAMTIAVTRFRRTLD